MESSKMKSLLIAPLALMVATAAFAAPQEPGTGTNPPAKHAGKRHGKHSGGKHHKGAGSQAKPAAAQPAGK
jgi:Spy/CpxP family protein refolding chaperone